MIEIKVDYGLFAVALIIFALAAYSLYHTIKDEYSEKINERITEKPQAATQKTLKTTYKRSMEKLTLL